MSTATFPKPSHVPITHTGHLYLPAFEGDEQPPVEAFGGTAHLPSEATDPQGLPKGEPGTWRRFVAAPVIGAMWPAYPAGRVVVFLDAEQRTPEDGETVYAALSVRKAPEPRSWWQWWKPKLHPHGRFRQIVAIRRYGHDAQGRVTLTPLQPGFKTWTQGEHDGEQAEILVLGVASGLRPHGYYISGVQC